MLIRNVLVEHELVNGAQGLVTSFKESDNIRRPKAILVIFDDLALQIWASTKYPGCGRSVPIEAFEAQFPLSPKRGTKAVEASRLQFPLRLAFSTTIHKYQGQTLDSVVVNMNGKFGPGQTYVSFSRCRSITGLEITDFKEQNIRVNIKAVHAQNNMQPLNITPCKSSVSIDDINVAYINCRSWNCHKRDIDHDPYFLASDISVFTETWLPFSAKVCIENKTSVLCNYGGQTHGGVMIIFSSNFSHTVFFSSTTKNLQVIAILLECHRNIKFPKILIIALYRSPSCNFSQFSDSLTELHSFIQNAKTQQYPVLLLGDFNVNLLDSLHRKIPIVYNQFVKTATCSTGSLIDHVYWTGDVNSIKCEVPGCYWSVHFIIETQIVKVPFHNESSDQTFEQTANTVLYDDTDIQNRVTKYYQKL